MWKTVNKEVVMRRSRILGVCLVFLLGAGALLADEGRDRGTRGPSNGGARSSDGARQINANGLSLVGNLSYNYSYNGNSGTVVMTADEVRNTRSGGVSGTLQLRLWATSTPPVFGQTINAFILGTYTLGQLNGGSSFFNVDTGLIPFTPPPPGTYSITMALMEYDGTQYVYQDFLTFSILQTFTGSSACTQTSTSLCLNNNRFRVTASWQTSTASGQGAAVRLTSDTGYFWFFSSNNVEMVVKVLNGCPLNSRYWVFSGGLTNVFVTIEVTDTLTGAVKIYTNPINTAFLPIQDTSAFATCP
jgi:hypothetical protein